MKKYISLEEQEKRAKLIMPLFQLLKTEKIFLDEIECVRIKYGISKKEKGIHNVPIHLLSQEYWKPNISSVATVNHYWPELKILWEDFHKDIEKIGAKYYLRNFLYLLKDFVLQNRFRDVLIKHRLQLWENGHTIILQRDIKKKDFDNIWLEIEKFNQEYPVRKSRIRRYSDEIRKKYRNTEIMENKYLADQASLRLLMKKQVFGTITQEEEMKIKGWDKSKKSRLSKLTRWFFSLVKDLDDAEW